MSGEAEYDSSDILVSAVRCCQLPVTAGVSLLWLRQSLFRVNLLRGPSYMPNLGVLCLLSRSTAATMHATAERYRVMGIPVVRRSP